ncbi:MAG: MBL fold metallo-hydrolase [Chloroflexota bacterium]|nr:MBL fold metallo-hydrolase [Chloroflexota bacterium]
MSGRRWPQLRGEQIAPGVHWLQIADAAWETSLGAHVVIVGSPKEAIVIDSAYDHDAPASFIAGYLAGMGNPTVKAILLTHHHRDHSGGAARLRAATGAPILCHPREAPLVAEATAADGEDGQPALPGTVVDGTIEDGAVLTAGGVAIRVVHTPGHSPGHCCFFLPESGLMLTGDLVLGNATTSVSPPHGDMADLLRSLTRLLDFPMTLIVPAHGPLVRDPRAAVAGVIAHRRAREEQVLAALGAGDDQPAAIVARVYPALEEKLVELACRQVTSILTKLAREGRVVADGEGEDRRWRLA